MNHEHHHDQGDIIEQKTLSRSRIVLIGFLIVIGYFLFTEHRAHVVAFLPYLLLLACPLMHIFMHHGHGGHGGSQGHNHDGQQHLDKSAPPPPPKTGEQP